MTWSMAETDSSALMIPDTSQSSETFAMSLRAVSARPRDLSTGTRVGAYVATSPGCMARMMVLLPLRLSSAAMC